jgi:hypothetical protein
MIEQLSKWLKILPLLDHKNEGVMHFWIGNLKQGGCSNQSFHQPRYKILWGVPKVV